MQIVIILKHMILLKQNRWPPEIYDNYIALLKRDYLLTVQNNYDLDISLANESPFLHFTPLMWSRSVWESVLSALPR